VLKPASNADLSPELLEQFQNFSQRIESLRAGVSQFVLHRAEAKYALDESVQNRLAKVMRDIEVARMAFLSWSNYGSATQCSQETRCSSPQTVTDLCFQLEAFAQGSLPVLQKANFYPAELTEVNKTLDELEELTRLLCSASSKLCSSRGLDTLPY
jgi:chaperonin cofactor prefoldin